MSVLIKGKALPKCCGDCWLARCVAYSDYCRVLSVDINVIDPTYKHPNCPLVEIPEPHGRLIDADALKETLDYYICEANWGDEVNKALRWVKDEFINSENTVLEAEGSENHDT